MIIPIRAKINWYQNKNLCCFSEFQKRVLHLLINIQKELQAQQKVKCSAEGFTIARAVTLDEFVQLDSSSKKPEDSKAMVRSVCKASIYSEPLRLFSTFKVNLEDRILRKKKYLKIYAS